MADTERKRLLGQQPVSPTTGGGASVLMGLLSAAMGSFLLAAALGFITSPSGEPTDPGSVVGLLGALLVFAGLSFILHGLAGLRRQMRRKRSLAERPDEPWLADGDWSPRGTVDLEVARWRQGFAGLVLLTLLVVPFDGLWLSADEDPGCLFLVFLLPLNLLVVAGSSYAIYLSARRLKYGTAFLAFERFPFFLGETLEASLHIPRSAAELSSAKVTLRCVEEHAEATAEGRRVVSYQLWADSKAHGDRESGAQGRRQIIIAFALPEDETYTTALWERPARYWELKVEAEAPGLDFRSRFLVPIYSKS